jgi:hypothetical protein
MMLAGQAFLGGVRQHRVHDAAERRLGQKVVTDVVDRHIGNNLAGISGEFA